MFKLLRTFLGYAGLGVVLISSDLHAQPPTIFNLGVLPGATAPAYSSASAVSADGSVVTGSARGSVGGWHAYRWTAASGMQSLGTLPPGADSFGASVDASGNVLVGMIASGLPRAFRWTSAGGLQDLGVLPGRAQSYATGVNADGSVVVGHSENSLSDTRAFRWTPTGGMHDIGTLPGFHSSEARAVNANGTVITGFSGVTNYDRAFRWTELGGMQDLGALPGGYSSRAYAINIGGDVIVGMSLVSSSSAHAFRWTEFGGMHDLGVLPGHLSSVATAVSADGSVVVGWSGSPLHLYCAFLWSTDLGTVDLNDYLTSLGVDLNGWVLTVATGVSSDGRVIIGDGLFEGEARAWLAVIPAPGASLCLLSIAGGLGLRRRRR